MQWQQFPALRLMIRRDLKVLRKLCRSLSLITRRNYNIVAKYLRAALPLLPLLKGSSGVDSRDRKLSRRKLEKEKTVQKAILEIGGHP